MITKTLALTIVTLLSCMPAAEDDHSLSAADIKKLDKPVRKAMDFLTSDKQSDFYDAIDDLTQTIEKIEKKSKFPALSDTAAWSALLSATQAPAKLSKGVSKSGRFGKARKLDGVPGKEYLLSVPRGYKVNQPVTVLLCLHPKLEVSGTIKTALEHWIGAQVPEAVSKEVVIVAPINEAGIDWATMDGCVLALSALKEGAFDNVHYDPARIYVVGDGAALAVAARFPSLFGGVELVGAPPEDIPYQNVAQVPILAIGADAAKVETAAGDTKLDLEKADDLSALADWMDRKKKTFYPDAVEVLANNAAYASAYWIQGVRLQTSGDEKDLEQFARIEAHVDREANEFVVSTNDKVLEFWLYLNDDLVDLDRPIKVVHNGKVRFEGTKIRSLTKMFKYTLTPTHGNLGAAFVNRIEISVD